MKSDDIKKGILRIFRGGELYGYDIHKKLGTMDVDIDLSRLYRILNDMKKEGLLESRWEKSQSGPRKRMYKVTEGGQEKLREILLEAIEMVHDFYGEYLMGLPPEGNPLLEILTLMTESFQGNENVAFITTKPFGVNEIIISIILKKLPEGKMYLVKPRSVEVNLELDNLLTLGGSYEDVPLKENFLDLVIVIDLPREEHLNDAVEEWNRILVPNGRLAIVTPSVLVKDNEDPLTIGDFVEKYEHEIIEKGQTIEKRLLDDTLTTSFVDIDERDIVHMMLLRARKSDSGKKAPRR
jgi:DNA-binding PadR family transcriptional regulator